MRILIDVMSVSEMEAKQELQNIIDQFDMNWYQLVNLPNHDYNEFTDTHHYMVRLDKIK